MVMMVIMALQFSDRMHNHSLGVDRILPYVHYYSRVVGKVGEGIGHPQYNTDKVTRPRMKEDR